MKNIILLFAAFIVLLLSGSSFKENQEPNAITEMVNGVDVYIYSKPSKKYEVIKDGTIITVSLRGIDGLVNAGSHKAFEQGADGIIINARNAKYESIKYIEEKGEN